MKVLSLTYLVAALVAQTANGAFCSESMEVVIDASAMKLLFTGFQPTVNRFTNMGMGNKIILKGYERMPMIETEIGRMSIAAGEACDAVSEPADVSTSSASKLLGVALTFFLGTASGGIGSGLAFGLAGGLLGHAMVDAQTSAECDLVPIEVDIYVDATSDEIVMRSVQSGDFEICPPESFYWKHHRSVYGGYEGCVGEKGMYPCPQDSQGIEDKNLGETYPLFWNNDTCVPTGYSAENRTFWVIWGDPLDKHELNARTGFNPVVSFPFNRGPYPAYQHGVPVDVAFDDSGSARAMAKDLLVFVEAFTEDALTEFEVSFTEGAEQGMIAIYAAKALEIATGTCTRQIFVLSESPAYGYSNEDSAWLANKHSDAFFNSTACPCYSTDPRNYTCKDPTITIETVGWLPNTPLPTRPGFDGVAYSADSDSPNSPWFESMVFPENPSGRLKTPQIPNANRLVCDGVYLWPMYFGMRNYSIPTSEVPDCSAWSFSITKAYSASVRAGFLMFKSAPAPHVEAFKTIMEDQYSQTFGLYSEWSWYGQMQLWEMMMSRPLSDPTGWIGAYSEIMDEKWTVLEDAFAGCPVTTITNPKAGAYAFFRMNEAYLGLQSASGEEFLNTFFKDVLGVSAPTYNWGFRGADPADFYGANYTIYDFIRLQLYRDVSVYEEIARRARIVCDDMDATVGDFLSVNQWAASTATTARRRAQGYINIDDRKRHLIEVVPDLTDRQLEYVAASHVTQDKMSLQVALCAPSYTMTCFFQKVGTRFNDDQY